MRLRREAEARLLPLFTRVRGETVWKIPDGIAVAYAPHHGKREVRHRPVQEVRHRLVRRRMEVRRSAPSRTQRARTPQDTRFAGDPRRRLLCPQERFCPWRLLPKDFPPWKSVYDWFRKWRIDGTWERLNAALREVLRARSGRGTLNLVPG